MKTEKTSTTGATMAARSAAPSVDAWDIYTVDDGAAANAAAFDQFAEAYDRTLNASLRAAGEQKQFFAHGRVLWLLRHLSRIGVHPASALDFGCGTGSSAADLVTSIGAKGVVGVDISRKSIDVARRNYSGRFPARFFAVSEYQPKEEFDLAYCNGVFHHIAPPQRPSVVQYIFRGLRPGGIFAFWENNPWNPGTRYIMAHCEFDADAITLTSREARRLLAANGFEIINTSFLFIFPRILKWLRPLEPLVSSWPVGGQYQVICRRPY